MLPDDAKRRRALAHEALKQTQVDNHLTTVAQGDDHKKLDIQLFRQIQAFLQ